VSQYHRLIKNDPRWKAARAEALERDGYCCVDCGATTEDVGRPLEVNHIERLEDIWETTPELAFEVSNLETLCPEHHAQRGRGGGGLVRLTWVNPEWLTELEPLVESDS
jgi:5-methylcytosine-specific restriction protein A